MGVAALVYAKLIALCLARLLELAVEEREARRATRRVSGIRCIDRSGGVMMPYVVGTL